MAMLTKKKMKSMKLIIYALNKKGQTLDHCSVQAVGKL